MSALQQAERLRAQAEYERDRALERAKKAEEINMQLLEEKNRLLRTIERFRARIVELRVERDEARQQLQERSAA